MLGEKHLNYLVREFVQHYHMHRPHQSLGNLPPKTAKAPAVVELKSDTEIVCHERLGGLLKHYEWKSA